MRIKLSAEAGEEMLDAAAWYEEREQGLGAEFIAACDRAFKYNADDPGRHLTVGRGFHRYLMPRLPFSVFYEAEGDLLIIAGVFHGARNPEHRRRRIGID